MIEIGRQEKIEEYFLSGNLSQSEIKKSDKSVFDIEKGLNQNAPWIKIGSAVDVILTGEEGAFDKQFYVAGNISVSDTLKGIVDDIFFMAKTNYQNYLEESEKTEKDPFLEMYGSLKEVPEAVILEICQNHNYGKSYKPETRIKKVLECQEYYVSRIKGDGKIVLSSEENETVQLVCSSLREHPRTKGLFIRDFYREQNNLSIMYQVPVYFTYKKVKCKALLDIVIVEVLPNGDVSVTPVDLKTTSNDTFYFPKSFVSYRYYIQAIFYTKAIKEYFAERFPLDSIVMNNFLFVVESTQNIGNPIVFEVDKELLEWAEHNGKYNQPSFDELFERAIFYRENGRGTELEVLESGLKPVKITVDGLKSAEQGSEEVEW